MTEKRIVPAKMTAKAVGASIHLVKKARAGKKVKGKMAKQVLHADELLAQGMNKLTEEVSRIVKI